MKLNKVTAVDGENVLLDTLHKVEQCSQELSGTYLQHERVHHLIECVRGELNQFCNGEYENMVSFYGRLKEVKL